MKYYGKGKVWLKVRMQGALVCFERPRGSDVQALLDKAPDVCAGLALVSRAHRAGGRQEVTLSVAAIEVRAVCAFLAAHTLSVEGLDWAATPDEDRACVWDEQPAADVMRVFGILLSAHAVPKSVDALNLIADPPPAPPVPASSAQGADDPSTDHDPAAPPVDDLGEGDDLPTDHDPYPGSSSPS